MFDLVPPDAIPGIWSEIAPGVDEVKKLTREPWSSREVLVALLTGHATLFRHKDGFVILERSEEAFSRLPYLNVWIAYFKPGRAKVVRPEFVDWLDEMQQQTECFTWKFSSPRLGWGALDECEVERVVYRRKKQ